MKDDKPYFGKMCVRCETPISTKQNKRALIAGHCGKCVDKLRNELIKYVKEELDRTPNLVGRPGDSPAGAPAVPGSDSNGDAGRFLAIGLVVGVAASFLLAILLYGPFTELLTACRQLLRLA